MNLLMMMILLLQIVYSHIEKVGTHTVNTPATDGTDGNKEEESEGDDFDIDAI